MESVVALLSNAQIWTVIGSGLAAFAATVTPIIVARYATKKAATEATATVKAAAEKAAVEIKTTARRDAVEEWRSLYGERQDEARELRRALIGLQSQNASQQSQLDSLKVKHDDCEDRHDALARKVESLSGAVTKIANGHGGQT